MLRHRSDVKCFKTKCSLNTFFRLDDHQYTLKSIFTRQATYFLFAEAIKQIFGIHQGISPLLHKEMP